ncbi:MAG: helical backbone metal receptor [Campylobacterota bacterium]|nr:helical backbone metal receptor [Campylobacterota bacterium]
MQFRLISLALSRSLGTRGKGIHVGWMQSIVKTNLQPLIKFKFSPRRWVRTYPTKILILFTMLLFIPLQAKERIVALSPVINELVFAMDRGDRVVANTQYASYPPQSRDIAKVGGFFDVSFEAILKAKPTLVIMQHNNRKLQKRLKSFGIASAVIKVDRLQSIKEAIVTIGGLVDNSSKARQIVDSMDAKLQSVANIVKNKKILMVIGESLNLHKGIFIVGHDLYLNDIITASGNSNAFGSKLIKQPVLNYENIIATEADIVIVLAPYQKHSPETIKKAWLSVPIPAAQKGNIFIIDKEYAGIPSDRLVFFLKDFREILKRVE